MINKHPLLSKNARHFQVNRWCDNCTLLTKKMFYITKTWRVLTHAWKALENNVSFAVIFTVSITYKKYRMKRLDGNSLSPIALLTSTQTRNSRKIVLCAEKTLYKFSLNRDKQESTSQLSEALCSQQLMPYFFNLFCIAIRVASWEDWTCKRYKSRKLYQNYT